MADRNGFIQAAIDLGIKDPDKLNQGLISQGFDKLNKTESLLVKEGTYGTNIGQRFAKEIRDLGAGAATILGGAYGYLTDKNTRNTINQAIGGELRKGLGNVALDTANLILSPYNNLTVQKAISQPISETVTDITSGAVAHPFNATLDALGLGGGRILNKGGKALYKALPEGKGFQTAKGILGGLVDPTIKQVNQILNTARDVPVNKIEGLKNQAFNLYNPSNTADLSIVYKNLEAPKGKWEGTPEQIKLTNDVKNFTEEVNKLMVKAGVDPNKAREVAETQYILRNLQEQGLEIPFDDVRKIVDNNVDTIKKYNLPEGYTKDIIPQLKEEAKVAFDSGLITPIRHGSVGADTSQIINRFDSGALSSRRYGNQSYEQSAKSFYPSYVELLSELEKVDQSTGALAEIARSIGKKVNTIDEVDNIKSTQVLISPSKLTDDLAKSLEGQGKINTILKDVTKLSNDDIARYANDLYIINKKDAEAFSRAYSNNLSDASKGLETLSKASSLGKQVALGTPRYIAGNQITNVGLNIIEGVTPRHYALAAGEYSKYIPDALRRSTSYTGYLDKDLPIAAGYGDVYKRLVDDFKKGNSFEKLRALNLMTTYPIFRTAQGYEIMDRYSNYIRQAEKYAKQVNKTTEEILKEAKEAGGNNPTYRRLKEMVDNSLGDYTGRNYYIDPRLDFYVRQTFLPFYRPYTQGLRVLGTHSILNPLRQQVFLRNPSRIGNEISERFTEMGGAEDPVYGGFPVSFGDRYRNPRVAYSPYQSVSALSEIVGNPKEFLSNSNTFIAPLLFPFMGINRYGDKAKLPNSYSIGGQQYIMDNNGNVVNTESTNPLVNTIRLFLSNLANTYVAPVSAINRIGIPLTAEALDMPYRSPSDYSIFGQIGEGKLPFLFEGREASRPKSTTGERVLPMFGLSVRDVFERSSEKPLTIKQQARIRRSIQRQQKRNEE